MKIGAAGLTVAQVMEIIEASPGDKLAHGYDFERLTVDIELDNDGHMMKILSDHQDEVQMAWRKGPDQPFPYEWFTCNIKRFYRNRTNEAMIALFETFGTVLLLTGPEREESSS
jgi:hypothetical protein